MFNKIKTIRENGKIIYKKEDEIKQKSLNKNERTKENARKR